MFLFIAILWYLQVLIPNSTQSISDVDALIDAGTKSLNKMNSSQVIKIEPVQSFLNSGKQFRNRVEQLDADNSNPILD
ncbi:MAG: hypothetical protein A2X61_05335 [Ignavibacteria bacterium GWB2_35_12]|nr:MAG: hypothetical protein A2X63_09400 [Ignavibacteria bacterium GWA2_35_8]OGU42149.1 MAG: hypothetical protein A2X61_05335 [Ignavibacteria bacterium GWB2_35_12]OGV19866.1 MAG: hypothetical protein A2475_01960 [Ignavibacteria bacterium RIFOXYC2_FULL_35_21]